MTDLRRVEVIGNIYETPELLEKDKKKTEWDSLLTDEEKELLKGVRCSVDPRTLHPEDVKIIIKHVREMASKSADKK